MTGSIVGLRSLFSAPASAPDAGEKDRENQLKNRKLNEKRNQTIFEHFSLSLTHFFAGQTWLLWVSIIRDLPGRTGPLGRGIFIIQIALRRLVFGLAFFSSSSLRALELWFPLCLFPWKQVPNAPAPHAPVLLAQEVFFSRWSCLGLNYTEKNRFLVWYFPFLLPQKRASEAEAEEGTQKRSAGNFLAVASLSEAKWKRKRISFGAKQFVGFSISVADNIFVSRSSARLSPEKTANWSLSKRSWMPRGDAENAPSTVNW
jgi:hypothetical protein